MRRHMMTALLSSATVIGFDWKKDGDALATDDAGNPIWINGSQELSVKGDTISSLQGEARRHRTAKEAAEEKLAKYDGIDDPDAARHALETVKDLKDGDLISKGKVDEVRNEITKQYETRISDAHKERDTAYQTRDNVLLDSAFNASEFARDRLAVPVEMVRATFGNRFKVEDGKVVAYDEHGQMLYSDNDMGRPATFDEALSKIVGGYKHKDTILKAPDAAGTGGGGGGGSRGQGRTIKRAEFETYAPAKQAEIARGGEVQIVD